ncbi:MAG: thioredoxin-like domain-containing protein [Verrucomicrobiota bacterium]
MKTPFKILLGILLTVSANAEFRTWTRNDGKTAEMDLISVGESSGGTMGEFKMRDGRKVYVAVSSFSAADTQILKEWKPTAAAPAPAAAAPSVFDSFLDGDLVSLKGKSLASQKDFLKPSKYYLFYYTASWCGPCQAFTPSLVDFYNANKPGNSEFEIVLITSDSDEDSMEEYAVSKKMTWPQLKLSKVERFKKEFKHPGTGIPNLVLTDTEGKLLKTSYVDGKYMGPASVMNHLGTLLKK